MRLTRKQFLSGSPDETGFIIITASSPRLKDMEESSYYITSGVDAEVQLGDCSSKIYLNFNFNKEADLQKRLDKLSVLINNLQELKDTLPILWDDARVSAAIYKELNKEKCDEKVSTN